MARIITLIATAGLALLVAAPALGKPVAPDPATEAQILRGEALGRDYQRDSVGVDPAAEAQILRGQALGRYYQGDPGQDPATEAQVLRGQALDRHFGLGRFAVDPATQAQVLRGEAMDRHYGLGRFSPSPQGGTDLGSGSSPVSVTSSGSDLDWAQLVAGLGIGVLLGTGLLVAIRVTRARPLGH